MKISLTTILSILLCVALIAAAVCIGAYRGWNEERNAALSALSENSEIRTALENRAMDAANLSVVAARHLPADDAVLCALQAASALILSGHADADALITADTAITESALSLAEVLSALPSVQQSARDQAYVTTLTGILTQRSGLSDTYSLLRDDFNRRFFTSLTGKLAALRGVEPLPAANAQ